MYTEFKIIEKDRKVLTIKVFGRKWMTSCSCRTRLSDKMVPKCIKIDHAKKARLEE